MDRKEHIIEVASHLFSERGFANTPLSLICEKASVSKGLIFHHFDSKNHLLREIFSKTTQLIVEINASPQNNQPPLEKLGELIEAFFGQLEQDKMFVQMNLNMILQPNTREILKDLVDERSSIILESILNIFQELDPENALVKSHLLIAELDGIALNFLCIFEEYPLEGIKNHLIQRYIQS